MYQIAILAVLIFVIFMVITMKNPQPDGGTEFCGWSTGGKCVTDLDCVVDGCSGQVCRSTYEDPVITTCEWKECYNAERYGVRCRCIEGRCRWG
ncbi:MAG: eight-cysteine-cluster domain-containing protein [Pyrobaculum sp.]